MPIPYRITCSVCGRPIEVSDRALDSEGDLFIEVKPCETCLAEVAESVEKEATS